MPKSRKPSKPGRPAAAVKTAVTRSGPRGSGRILTFAALLVVATVIVVVRRYNGVDPGSNRATPTNANTAATAAIPPAAPPAPVPPPTAEPNQVAPPPATTPTVASVNPRAVSPEAAEALRMLDGLLGSGQLTNATQRAELWNAALNRVHGLGPAGVPAIRDFLARNLDADIPAGVTGTNLTATTLRAQLIDTLARVGGIEGTEALVGVLRTAAVPGELAQIARNLEWLSPGVFRPEILQAANSTLDLAQRGELAGYDVAPLFQTLQNFGDAGTVPELQAWQKQWGYYATLALAGLPDGAGIGELIRQVNDPTPARAPLARFGMETLAQTAAGNPAAGNALVDLVRADRVPIDAWATISARLVGEDLVIGAAPKALQTGGQFKSWHLTAGNQNYYAALNRSQWDAAEYQRRREVLDRLIAALPPGGDPGGHLRRARESLNSPSTN